MREFAAPHRAATRASPLVMYIAVFLSVRLLTCGIYSSMAAKSLEESLAIGVCFCVGAINRKLTVRFVKRVTEKKRLLRRDRIYKNKMRKY